MPSMEHINTPAIRALEHETFAGLDCIEHGLVVLRGATSWGARDRGFIELPTREGTLRVHLAYDEREAPLAVREDGTEVPDLLLSLTDENDYLACIWARPAAGSPLMGVGVDLSSREHFRERPPRRDGRPARDLSLLLFTETEQSLIPQLEPEDDILAKSALFAAKEAAFKCTASPLRRWYESHDDELLFEVRHFVMEEPGLERGTGRNGAAQAAMDRMGIARVVTHYTEVCGMALVTAVALAE